MKTYRPNTPRFALGLAAIASTAATIGLLAIAPADMHFRSHEVPVIAVTNVTPAAPTQVASGSTPPLVGTIDVQAVRESRLVTVVESNRAYQQRLRG